MGLNLKISCDSQEYSHAMFTCTSWELAFNFCLMSYDKLSPWDYEIKLLTTAPRPFLLLLVVLWVSKANIHIHNSTRAHSTITPCWCLFTSICWEWCLSISHDRITEGKFNHFRIHPIHVHVCACVCMCVCVCVRAYAWVCVCVCVSMHVVENISSSSTLLPRLQICIKN